ncbi:MAG: hypothetical protein K9N49_02635 [Candidatus Marinimicrobia bacterium]|nr:hypothetical protein [Candidatus Neomarinimicrobiota bacterium]
MNIYVELTRRFNAGGLIRAVLAGGQAVVLHKLAIMSKDGDWILREDAEAVAHILGVLGEYGASYRFGAPLDVRWLRGGWSSHFEFRAAGLRVRTDFVSRPPRLPLSDLEALWASREHRDPPFVGARALVEMKKTNREKDYAVIGELARLLVETEDQILCSRSARDLLDLRARQPTTYERLQRKRPALRAAEEGREALERALDEERRQLMHANERRLERYMSAAQQWAALWPEVSRAVAGLSLSEAHRVVSARAAGILPERVEGLEP